MARPIGKQLAAAAILVGALSSVYAVPAGAGPLRRLLVDTRITAPLADPALVPGVAHCTSDRVCTVTDAFGTRPGSPLALGE